MVNRCPYICIFGVGLYGCVEAWKKEYGNDKGQWAKVTGVDEMRETVFSGVTLLCSPLKLRFHFNRAFFLKLNGVLF